LPDIDIVAGQAAPDCRSAKTKRRANKKKNFFLENKKQKTFAYGVRLSVQNGQLGFAQ
jgi:hypothetical protein